MKISIITVFPQLYDSFLKTSLIARAIDNNLIQINLIKFSDMCPANVRIDAPSVGPGTGMLIKPDIVKEAIKEAEEQWGKGFKIFFSPQGLKLNQPLFKRLANNIFNIESPKKEKSNKFNNHLILVCARYEGMDERVENYYADLILSIGDYILMGADLPAQVFLEGFLRLVPGVVGKLESVKNESFDKAFLDYPSYCLPVEWKGLKIPAILQSGNHAEIEKWRRDKAAEKTIYNKFDWFVKASPTKDDINIAKNFIPNHYVALMHSDVFVKENQVGNTSIASLDIHDIARSSATYGIKNYFIVTKLKDQQLILQSFLDFWRSNEGKEYNLSRFQAVSRVKSANCLKKVIAEIESLENKKPIIITTSARKIENENSPKIINYKQQGEIFKQNRPILFLFGTGRGLSLEIVEKSDYLLLPIEGMTNYNHLSVRSAAAIILDRWLGLHPEFYY